MGIGSIVALIVGNLIGAGVFLMPAKIAPFGMMGIWGLLVTSLGAFFLSLLFSQLSMHFPNESGPHQYVNRALGRSSGMLISNMYYLLSCLANAAYPVMIVGSIHFLYGETTPMYTLILEILILSVVTWINLSNIKLFDRVEIFLTIFKVIPLIIIPLFALPYINHDMLFTMPSTSTDFNAIQITAIMFIWGYMGVESGTVSAQSVKNPSQTIPKATLIAMMIVFFIYFMGTSACMSVIAPDQLAASAAPYADLATFLFGGGWGAYIGIITIIASFGALNGWTWVVGRIGQTAAQEGLMHHAYRYENNGVPKTAILGSSLISLAFMTFSLSPRLIHQFYWIVDIAVALVLWVYGACVIAHYVLLKDKKIFNIREKIINIMSAVFVVCAFISQSKELIITSLGVLIFSMMVVYVTRKLKWVQ
jgi:APA family basic amino acid/polyamine antiporter